MNNLFKDAFHSLQLNCRYRSVRRNKYMFLIGKSVEVIAFMAMQRYKISLQVLKLFFNMRAKFGISKAAM